MRRLLLVLLLLLTTLGQARADAPSWTGSWDTTWRDGGARMDLTQTGSHVSGGYPAYGGLIDGEVQGRQFDGTWTEGKRTGGVTFVLSADGQSFMGRFDNGQWWTGGRTTAQNDGVTLDQSGARQALRSFVAAGNAARAGAPDQLAVAAAAMDFGPAGADMAPGQKIAAAQALYNLVDLTTFQLWAIPGKRAVGPLLTVTLQQAGTSATLPLTLLKHADQRWFIALPEANTLELARKSLLARSGGRAPPPDDYKRRGSARDTMRSFANAFADWDGAGRAQALAALDLSDFSDATRDSEGELVAEYLNGILDRVGSVVPQEIPDDPGSRVPYLVFSHPAGRVTIGPVVGGTTWQFTADTVRSARDLFTAVEDMPAVGSQSLQGPASTYFMVRSWVRDHAPSLFARAGELEAWQAIGIVVILVAAAVLATLIAGLVLAVLRLGVGGRPIDAERQLAWPLRLALVFGLYRLAAPALGLPEGVKRVTLGGSGVLLALAIVWGGWKLLDTFASHSLQRAERRTGTMDDILISLVLVLCKLLLLAGGLVYIASQLSLPYDSVLAGLGIGGLAVAFASKETLSNVFGAAILVADRPFRRGDWIVADATQGTVEHVGIRSTRIRTAEDSLVVVPNGKLSDATVNNLGTRRTRLVKTSLSLNYATTPGQLETFMAGLLELVGQVAMTVPGQTQVGLSGLTPDGIGVQLTCYLDVRTGAEERASTDALLLGALRLAQRMGIALGKQEPRPAVAADSDA